MSEFKIASQQMDRIKASVNWTSDYCYKHVPEHLIGTDTTDEQLASLKEKYKVRQMIIDNEVVCSRCVLDADTKRLSDEALEAYNERQKQEVKNILINKSLFQDETLKHARFDNYVIDDTMHEARVNFQKVRQYTERYAMGDQFNLLLTGNVGVGKSHLSVSVLKELWGDDVSCLFIDIDEMFTRIKDSFNNKESIYTKEYFVDLLGSVDFLALDDLGAETGDVDTDKRASDFTNNVLRAVMNARQNKSTIITTNLTGEQVLYMYDAKLVDRMFKQIEVVKYSETLSYRTKKLGF